VMLSVAQFVNRTETAPADAVVAMVLAAATNAVFKAGLAVSSGRAQLGFADTPVADYQVKQSSGEFKIIGAAYAPAPYGLAMPKNGFDKAVLAAVQELVKNGTYGSIFSKWGLQGIEVPLSQVKINGATS